MMVNLSAPKTFKVIECMLMEKCFSQYKISKETGVNFSLVNRINQWLIDRGLIALRDNKYELKDAAGIIQAMAVYRHMKSLQMLNIHTALDKKQLEGIIPKKTLYCLESALEEYGGSYISNRVCIYGTKTLANELKQSLAYRPGTKTEFCIYEETPKVAKTEKKRNKLYTGKIRTVIDLVCDNRANEAEQLYKELWGIKLG